MGLTCLFGNIAPFAFTMILDVIQEQFVFSCHPSSFVQSILRTPRTSTHLSLSPSYFFLYDMYELVIDRDE